jgi:hypothetical protein
VVLLGGAHEGGQILVKEGVVQLLVVEEGHRVLLVATCSFQGCLILEVVAALRGGHLRRVLAAHEEGRGLGRKVD